VTPSSLNLVSNLTGPVSILSRAGQPITFPPAYRAPGAAASAKKFRAYLAVEVRGKAAAWDGSASVTTLPASHQGPPLFLLDIDCFPRNDGLSSVLI
jgi:hypothetical protein